MKTAHNRAFGAPIAILNRTTDANGKAAFQLPEDGYYHLLPIGEFPGHMQRGEETKEAIQVIDEAAIDSILNHFAGEVLVDYEHFSHDADKATTAAAWIESLEKRADGIWGKLRLSDKGRADIAGGNYRYISPECDQLEDIGNGKYRLLTLSGAGLTNRPMLKTLTPLTNRERNTETPMDYKSQLIQLLGLKADATDEEITAALAKKANAASPSAAEVETLRTENRRLKTENEAALNRQVETDLETFKDVIADRDLTKGMLVANRDQTVKFLQGLKDASAKGTRVYNRSTAAPAKGKDAVKGTAHDEFEVCVRNRMATEKCTYTRAYEDCKVLNRDKFDACQKEDAAEDTE